MSDDEIFHPVRHGASARFGAGRRRRRGPRSGPDVFRPSRRFGWQAKAIPRARGRRSAGPSSGPRLLAGLNGPPGAQEQAFHWLGRPVRL